MNKYTLSAILLLICKLTIAQVDYSVLNYWTYYSDAENTLYKQQCDIAFKYMEERSDKISQLKTIEDWRKRQQEVKETLYKIVGPFPEKTPLNPVTTEKIKADGFSVEKLYFESMPGYKVTAAFFIPGGKKRNLPTIIFCSGHSDLGFRSDVYQTMILNLVMKGFAVFAFDPYGQGERLQYFDEKQNKSRFSSTREHSYPGAQLFVNGASTARYMIWDGIRCVDYLLTRKEVDPENIGITGRSGGGTQSSHIAAFDERIKAVAPECYVTTFEYLLKSNGPQDAEQNFYHGFMEGIDLADLLEVRAPKPALMITTTRDIFSIQGARETREEIKKVYDAYDLIDNFQMIEDDAGHQSTKKNREAMYAFFQKHLDNSGSSEDLEVKPFPAEALHVTETGQLSTSIESKFLFDINKTLAEAHLQDLIGRRQDVLTHLESVKNSSRIIAGFQSVQDFGKLVFSGRTVMDSYTMDKYLVEYNAQYVLPFIVFAPRVASSKAALYLDDLSDKESEESYEIPLQLVKDGITVIVPDLPGYGETGPGYMKGDAYFNNTSYNQWFAGIQNGKSMMAIHAESIQKVLYHCNTILDMEGKKVTGISKGAFNSSLLHAATFGIGFDNIFMIEPIMSFASIVSNKEYEPSFIPFSVAGGLKYYDLPDLVADVAPKKVLMYNSLDHLGRLAEKSEMDVTYDFVEKQYKSMDSESNFIIVSDKSNESLVELLSDFFKE